MGAGSQRFYIFTTLWFNGRREKLLFSHFLFHSHLLSCPSCFSFNHEPCPDMSSLLPPSALHSHQPAKGTGILTKMNGREIILHNHSIGWPTLRCCQPRFQCSHLWRLMFACFVCLTKVWHEALSKSPSGKSYPVCSDDWFYCAVCLLGQGDAGDSWHGGTSMPVLQQAQLEQQRHAAYKVIIMDKMESLFCSLSWNWGGGTTVWVPFILSIADVILDTGDWIWMKLRGKWRTLQFALSKLHWLK